MTVFDRKNHWETVYSTKSLEEVSWYQPEPTTSLQFIKEFALPKTSKVIDVGGGDSFLVDYLLAEGFEDISVLDISETALEKAKKRLGEKAEKVKWIIADIATFVPTEKYDLWHDRAVFHFLTKEEEIQHYLEITQKNIAIAGILIIGTFSEVGPKKCSGIEIKQYSKDSMTDLFKHAFDPLKCISIDHNTPFNTIQNFIFCGFLKK
ncbi:MAG: class I SAM-dependent methyltransferase [Bacteroidia bacterium]